MRTVITKHRMFAALVVASSLAFAGCAATGEAEEASSEAPTPTEEAVVDQAEFFDGKTITLVVPYNPGGGFDTFVRLLAPELEKEIPGVKVTVENQPGGGGLIGANGIFQSDPDGLTLGLINYPGAVFAEMSGAEGVAFTTSDWTMLTRLGAINPLVYTGKDSGYASFDSMLKADKPVVFGIGGVGSDAYYATKVLAEVLGFPYEIVAGYPGSSEADGALIVGEVDASVNSVDKALSTVEGSGAIPAVYIGTEPSSKLPNVPTITSFGDADQKKILTALASIYDLERLMVGPPGMDEGRAAFLGEAIYRAATGTGYIDAMKAAGITPSPLARENVTKLAKEANSALDILAPIVKK
jgi:tripartite-type tricarboxylate transporter receptor subunit TctC